MISVQRRFNSTERIRVTRDHVRIVLDPPADLSSFPCASAQVNLTNYDFPAESRVVLDAYYRSSSMRFDCGTVGRLDIPARMELTDVALGGAIQFRLLIIEAESGRILGSAEGLRPYKSGESPDRQPLLTLRETNDLGNELWRIEVDERTGPILCINNAVPGLAAQLRGIPLIQGLILPHAFRMILQELSAPGEDEEDDLWGENWRRFLRELGVPAEPESDDPDTREEWVQSAVAAFCDKKDFIVRVRTSTLVPDSSHV